MSDDVISCPSCGEPTPEDASFCEACGADLTGPTDASDHPPCVSCGAAGSEILDGYCMQCGHKQPGPRDHMETDLGSVAGVSDRGKRHHHNEDSMALALVGDHRIMVVCDGVSSTADSDVASQAAADAALAELVSAVETGGDVVEAMAVAVAAAQDAVLATPAAATNGSCTFVAAVAAPQGSQVDLTLGWLGDSRAYWVGANEADHAVLTVDHNWANELASTGTVTEAEARAHPQAATLTRWIGADATDVAPSTATFSFAAPGSLLVCSDGLWNYGADAAALAAAPGWSEATPLAVAQTLTAWANDQGGHDNITTLLARFTKDTVDGTAPAAPTDPLPEEPQP